MNFFTNFIQSIFVLSGIIILGALLKKKGFFKSEHSNIFARIVTDITLPALIFSSLAVQKISFSQMEQPFIMGIAELICIAIAWWIGGLLKLGKPQKGAFILAAVFGSSAFLGYPVINGAFPGNAAAMADAVITSEFGVGIFIFTLGVMIAMYFGTKEFRAKEGLQVFLNFLWSPVFLSLMAGLLVSIFLPNKNNMFFKLLMNFTQTVGAANTVFVLFSIGIILEIKNMRAIFPLALCACILKLIIKPILVIVPSEIFNFPLMWKQVLVIEAAMPTAALSVVFSSRYGCDSGLASKLLIATLFCSVFTMIGVIAFLF